MAVFSIIIPLYNKETHIAATLISVLSQTFQDFEIIVVNDGSTDHSENEVKRFSDKRIKLFTIENHGVSYARNFGVSKASFDLVVLLDADDLWKPTHLEDLKRLYQEFPNCGLYATAYEYKFNSNTLPAEYFRISKESKWSGIVNDFFESSSIHCIASSSSVMIPKIIYEKVGGFNTEYNFGEDTDLWIRLALKNKVAFTNTVSVIIDLNAENQASKMSITSGNIMDFDQFKDEEKTNQSLKKYLDLNRFSIAIQQKMVGNNLEAKKLIDTIDYNNLNAKQRLLLQMNSTLLKLMVQIKNLLRKNGIGLSAFR